MRLTLHNRVANPTPLAHRFCAGLLCLPSEACKLSFIGFFCFSMLRQNRLGKVTAVT